MQADVWYDLVVRELSAATDAARERRREVEPEHPRALEPVAEPEPPER